MPPASPSGKWQLVSRLYPGDEWALVTRSPRRLIDCAPVGPAAKEPVSTHSHPLTGVRRAVRFDPSQFAGKINRAVGRLDPEPILTVQHFADLPLFVRSQPT